MDNVVYLVDASMFIHRSYHAIRSLTTRDGRPTNAVYGFVATINKLLREKKPKYIALAFDAKGPNFRHELYPEYKANRPPMPEDLVAQQEPIRRIVEAMGLKSLETTGLEADDLIASLAARFESQGFEVVIVSADKDFYQLLSDRVTMYDPNPKRERTMTPAEVEEKVGIPADRFLDAQGLMGDSTDNIPGVPGVGEKTAAKLIAQFGDMENLFANLDQVKQQKLREKLRDHQEAAFLSRDLARLKTDADLTLTADDLTVPEPDVAALREMYQ